MKRPTSVVPLDDRKHVHGANLCQVFSKEPENLVISFCRCLSLRLEPRCVVQPKFMASRSSGPRPDTLVHRKQADTLGTAAEIRSRGGDDNKEAGTVGCADTKGRPCADEGWAEVQAVSWDGGDPSFLDRNQLLDQDQELVSVEFLVEVLACMIRRCGGLGDAREGLHVPQIGLDAPCSWWGEIGGPRRQDLHTPAGQ